MSWSEIHRVAYLKWRDAPPGMSPALADEFMQEIKSGKTIRMLTSGMKKYGPAIVSRDRFKKHCELHPEWGQLVLAMSDETGRSRKGIHQTNKTHCPNGHPFAEHGRIAIHKGYRSRQCRACERLRYAEGHPIKPDVLRQVKVRLAAKAPLSSFTKAGSSGYLVKFSTLARYRRENPDFNRLVLNVIEGSNSRAQLLRYQRGRNNAVRDQNNDYYKIREMVPAQLADRDDIVSMIIEDLLTGALKREDVRDRVRAYIKAQNRLLPSKHRKFGDGLLDSLDEVMFEDGSTTRGDTVSRGLWD
jgi:hypothetical protein